VTRSCAALALGVLVVAVACAAPQSVVNQTPAGQVSTSPKASPTPSPSPSPLAITAAPFHAGEIGFSYTPVGPTAKGGVPPYRWEIADGALPAGLSIASSGNVTGTPTILGTYLFSIRVTDAVGVTTTLQSSISISRRVVVTGNPCTPVSPCNVEAGCITVCGVFGFQTGGIGPYKYKVVSGALPTGMGLSGFSLTKGFPAPPSQSGKDWVFTLRVTDAIGATAQMTAKFHVFPHIGFVPSLGAKANCTSTGRNASCKTTLSYTLGTPNLTSPKVNVQVISGGTLPAGYSATAASGIVTFSVPGGTAYTGSVRLVLIDTSTCGANVYCASLPATVSITIP
jgi:large repetitive protein